MAPSLRSQYWQQLKLAAEMGMPIKFEKAFVSYTEAELKALVDQHLGEGVIVVDDPDDPVEDATAQAFDLARAMWDGTADAATGPSPAQPGPGASSPLTAGVARESGAQAATPDLRPPVKEWGNYAPETLARLLGVPFNDQASRRAGLTFSTHGPDDVLRVASDGKVWYQDEVPKPAIPMPRMRRRLRYINTGTKTVERRGADGRLDESFEVPGDGHDSGEILITLPSFQVGIYYDPRLPFRVHTYNGRRGFDYMDVIRFYGGLDLVPTSIATVYVGGDLCYDINKTRDTMERELREAKLGRS
ncbi:hypothetical protein SEA_JORDANFARM_50 [Microbacterium phage JordanFarm]